jgi:uncharacterized protein with gpF-like domain
LTYNLSALVKRKTPRAKTKVLRAVNPPISREQELNRIYMNVIRSWEYQINNVVLPAYRDALPQAMSKDSNFVIDAWWETVASVLGTASARVAAVVQQTRAKVTAWAVGLQQDYTRRWAKSVEVQTKVDPSPYMDPSILNGQQAIAIENTTATVESLSKEIESKVTAQVWRGLSAGTPQSQLALSLKATIGTLTNRVQYYQKENTTKFICQVERLIENEATLLKYTWHHTPQKHPREYHVRRDGHVFSWANPPWDGPPGTQPNCKCKARPILVLDVDPPISHIPTKR